MSDRTGTGGILYSSPKAEGERIRDIGNRDNDNEMVEDGDTIHLFEAPDEDDSQRGFYTVWQPIDDPGWFESINHVCEGKVYEKFKQDTS